MRQTHKVGIISFCVGISIPQATLLYLGYARYPMAAAIIITASAVTIAALVSRKW